MKIGVAGYRRLGVAAMAAMLVMPTVALAQEVVTPAAPPAVAVPVSGDAAAESRPNAEPKVVAAKPDPKDPDAVVCKWERDTGSRTKSTKICASRRQWAANAREVSKQYQNQPNAQTN